MVFGATPRIVACFFRSCGIVGAVIHLACADKCLICQGFWSDWSAGGAPGSSRRSLLAVRGGFFGTASNSGEKGRNAISPSETSRAPDRREYGWSRYVDPRHRLGSLKAVLLSPIEVLSRNCVTDRRLPHPIDKARRVLPLDASQEVPAGCADPSFPSASGGFARSWSSDRAK
jgi:hypothetical protein